VTFPVLLFLQTTTGASQGGSQYAGGTTVSLDPGQVEMLIQHQDANSQAIMLGIGLLLIFLSALTFIEVNKGRRD